MSNLSYDLPMYIYWKGKICLYVKSFLTIIFYWNVLLLNIRQHSCSESTLMDIFLKVFFCEILELLNIKLKCYIIGILICRDMVI